MTSCLNCGMLILDSEVDRCPYCKYLFTQIPARNVPESQPDKVETAILWYLINGRGVRMCDFCRNKKKIIDGKGNLVLFGAENNMIFDNSDGKEVAGAVKINFCPIFGRKLV